MKNSFNFLFVALNGLVGLGFIRVFGVALGFALHLWLANILGGHQYGLYAFASSISMFLVVVAKFGFDAATLRFMPGLLAGKRQPLGSFSCVSFLIVSIASLILMLAIAIYMRIYDELIDTKLTVLWGIVFLVPLRATWDLVQSRFQSLGYLKIAMVPVVILYPLLTALFAYYASRQCVTIAFDILLIQSGVLFFFLSVAALWGVWFRKLQFGLLSIDFRPVSSWLSVAALLCATSVAQVLYSQSDILVLGVLVSAEEIGAYAAAVKIAAFVSFGLDLVNFKYGPVFSRCWDVDRVRLQESVTESIRAILWITIPLGCLILLMASPILALFSESFSGMAIDVLRILILGQMINALCGPVGFLCSMTNQQVPLLLVTCVSAIFNLALNFSLIPEFGLMGAAVSTVISFSFRNISLFLIVRRKLKISLIF